MGDIPLQRQHAGIVFQYGLPRRRWFEKCGNSRSNGLIGVLQQPGLNGGVEF